MLFSERHLTAYPEPTNRALRQVRLIEMSDTKPVRLDPMRNVMPLELLSVADWLVRADQNERYWRAIPKPKRPVGQVKYERSRQAATFAVPALVLGLAALVYGSIGVLYAVPVAGVVAFGLDKWLATDIAAKLVRDNDIDRGRYLAVKFLSEQMGMLPEEVTLDMVRKMAQDYPAEAAKANQAQAEAAARYDAAVKLAIAPRGGKGGTYTRGVATGVAAAGLGVAAYAADTQPAAYTADPVTTVDEVQAFEAAVEQDFGGFNVFGDVNPANGVPMIQGTPIDVQGNTFGTDGF